MTEKKVNYDWDFFENIYDNVLKKGQTFSNEMGNTIQQELEKMYKEHEEWLNRQQENKNDTD